MTELQVYPKGTKLNNLQRRTLARAEMFHFPDANLFRYICTSQHIRHYRAKDGVMWHDIADVLNVVYEPKRADAKDEFEVRWVWRDMKKRLSREDIQLWGNISHIKLPAWDDHRWYKTDIISTGWLFFLITGLHTPIANKIRSFVAESINDKERETYVGKVQELDKELYGVGSATQLAMQSLYEVGDYDETDWRLK